MNGQLKMYGCNRNEFYRILIVCLIAMALIGCSRGRKTIIADDFEQSGLNAAALPARITEESLSFTPGSIEQIVGFSGKDLRSKDMSTLTMDFMAESTFSSNTQWPEAEKLPSGTQPAEWLEAAKDPGLGVTMLNDQGVTGKGVSVAVFDKPIRFEHREFNGRITYNEAAANVKHGWKVHFHGIGAASLLAGAACGVAPQAKLYYYAVPDAGKNFTYYTEALKELVRTNRLLEDDEKIRIVSISDGIGEDDPAWDGWQKAVQDAEAAKITVFYSNVAGDSGFTWGGCPPTLDRQNPENYTLSKYLTEKGIDSSAVIIPGDYRTTAGNAGNDHYIYSGKGGFSWAIPYITGLAALAWQEKPDLSFTDIVELLQATAVTTSSGHRVVNPPAFIEAVRRQ